MNKTKQVPQSLIEYYEETGVITDAYHQCRDWVEGGKHERSVTG